MKNILLIIIIQCMFKAIVKILHKNSTFAFEQQIHFLNDL